ncbi:hairy-related 11 [Cheilinus undulatus]|uniref:hairy-related 11 n=1 Tax=Cheilinus undulatus TaxID=241271 RepID=UPI001BD27236|nr:hairy-related 11 [Cheilinus undulatus]
MTRKLQNPTLEDSRSRKRALKPVVEKKRRDRINQSLVELRHLLSKHTSDPRLQNPKLEKAEILDLTVEYLQKWTEGGNLNNDFANSETKTHSSAVDPSESKVPYLFTLESAGFRECVAKMTKYMHRITPTQRASLIAGLKLYTENQQTNSTEADLSQGVAETTKGSDETSLDSVYTSRRKEDCTKLLFSSHSPFQPHSCSTPCHDYLSPPPSPWLPSSLSTYAPSPPFPSFASHFSSPPTLSPLSSNTSFFSFSPTVPHPSSPAVHCPPFVTLRPPPQPVQREGSLPNPVTPIWRPWF